MQEDENIMQVLLQLPEKKSHKNAGPMGYGKWQVPNLSHNWFLPTKTTEIGDPDWNIS